jgi:hypothetical protein
MVCMHAFKSKPVIDDVGVPENIRPNEPHGTTFRNGNIDFR